jgi:L-threonylcarbamoyladenylate synthase
MQTIRVSPVNPDAATISAAVRILLDGGVIAFATDTLYGLAADPRREDAVSKLFDAKGRDERVPVPLIAADLEQARAAGEFGELELRLARHFWPGPLTIVVPAKPIVSKEILAGRETVGIRVPAHEVARALCASVGSCLTATSANLSGHEAPASASDIDPRLAARIDAIVDSGPAPGGLPSTIVSASADGVQLLRAGAIAWDRVIKLLQ